MNEMGMVAEEISLEMLRQQNQSLLAQLKQRQSQFKGLLSGATLERTSHFAESEPCTTTRSAREKLAHYSKAVDTSYRVKRFNVSDMAIADSDATLVKPRVMDDGAQNRSGAEKTLTSTPKRSSRPDTPKGSFVTPERPTTMMDRQMATPDRPTITPDRQMAMPDRPVTRPDRPATRPDRPSTTSERPTTTPDRPTAPTDIQKITPNRPTMSLTGTPRSILKHRKIIDDNVHVESKYVHTPIAQRTPQLRNNGLNYSYSNVDESFTAAVFRESTDSRVSLPTYSRATDGSYLEEYPCSNRNGDGSFPDDLETSRTQGLLFDPSNDRQNSRRPSERPQGQKTVAFESGVVSSDDDESSPRPGDNINNSNVRRRKSTQTHRKPQQKQRPAQSPEPTPAWRKTNATQPLLGYDWIAGILDNQDKSVINASDKFYERISEFRWQNKADCATDEPLASGAVLLSRPVSPQIQDPGHTCIHGFTVNERLFTEPTNADDNGCAVCNVCLVPRKKPSQRSPSFVRVSIPQSQIEKHAHEVKPHRRRSFDPSDSCALSEHCLAGWECSRPSHLPTASGLDLKHATNKVTSQLSMTMAEVEQQLSEHSRAAKLGLRANGVTTARGHLNMTHARNLRRLQLA